MTHTESVMLRLPTDLLTRIDEYREEETFGNLRRSQFFRIAAEEKIARDSERKTSVRRK